MNASTSHEGLDRQVAVVRGKRYLDRRLLLVDSAANLALGLPLLVAPRLSARFLGLPLEASLFYQRVLGGVLTGIAAALALEYRREKPGDPVGLGMEGAIAINALGAASVAAWLRSPAARALPLRGRLFLWAVAISVLGIGVGEGWHVVRNDLAAR